jgi:hypothetical protein
MSKQFERLELNHLITEDALLSQWATFEVSGSIEALPPGPAVVLQRGGDFSFAVPSIGPGAVASSLLKEVARGS